MKNLKLGTKVRDKITGFTGTITARCEYIEGYVQYCVTPKCKDGGDVYPKEEYVDWARIEVLDGGVETETADTGGVMPAAPES